MLLQPSDKILLAHRRLYDGDAPRHFVGEVIAYEDRLAKVRGYSFVRNAMSGDHIRKSDPRIKIVPLDSPAFLVYELPRSVAVDALRFIAEDDRLVLTDDAGFVMNMAEATSGHSI